MTKLVDPALPPVVIRRLQPWAAQAEVLPPVASLLEAAFRLEARDSAALGEEDCQEPDRASEVPQSAVLSLVRALLGSM
jgi:hypothetical protein